MRPRVERVFANSMTLINFMDEGSPVTNDKIFTICSSLKWDYFILTSSYDSNFTSGTLLLEQTVFAKRLTTTLKKLIFPGGYLVRMNFKFFCYLRTRIITPQGGNGLWRFERF